MPDASEKSSVSRRGEDLAARVLKRQERMLRGREHRDREFWRSVSMLGVVGWSVALPTVIGIAIGVWLDGRWPEHFSWTLMLMTVGLMLGCVHAWVRVRRG